MNIVKKVFNRMQKYWLSLHSPMWQAKRVGLQFGKQCQFYTNFWSSEPYLIEIGDHCQITAGVKIFTHGGGNVLRIEHPDFDCFGKVKLGDNVYVGNNALIMPGVTIGNNVIIAAGSVVCHSMPDNVVVGGNPARIISSIVDYNTKNLPYNTHSKQMSFREKRELLLSLPDDKFIVKRMLSFRQNYE